MVRFGFSLVGLAVLAMAHAAPPLAVAQERPADRPTESAPGGPMDSATENATGVLNAVAFRPVPAGAPILVRPLDDTNENLAIKKDIEDALTTRGFRLGTDPKGIVLSFETRSQPGYWTSTRRRTFIELQGSAGSGTRAERSSKGMVNLYDSQRGAVLNKGQRSVVTPAATVYRLDVNIDDKAEGKSLWLAWAVANLAEGDPVTLAGSMVPVIIDSIGKSAKEQSFKLR
jgi:hypothetical protein